MANNPSVIIIGAGASGIAAATRLLEDGFVNVTILEAENRIGGRIHSVNFDGSFVDLGGQWVHGETGNIVYETVKDLDLLSTSHNKFNDNTYYLSNGSIVDKHITDRLFDIGTKIVEDAESARSSSGTFGDYFKKIFNENVLKEFGNDDKILPLAKSIRAWIGKFFFCLNSGSWYEISTSGAHAFQSCEGDQQLHWRDKGYCTILHVLMKKIPNAANQLPIDDKIFLNKEVTEIVWGSNVTVSCSDGSVYNADHVIVTTSMGVLKKYHKSMFTPELPAYKVNCIESTGFGTINKILLKFPTKWWPDDLKGFSLLWTEEDRINLINEFGPSHNGRSWLEDIYGFYVIDSHQRVLLAFIVGHMAADVELLSDEVVIRGCMHLLKKFCGWKFNIPEANGVLRSKWNNNPHFCGCYSYVSIQAENEKASAEDLAKPLVTANGKETVLFAGEATHTTKFSTVHGAIETGYREADRLINMYNRFHYSKVVIIGAGMAGLGAATKLTELGCDDYLIIEAQDEVGGRIKTLMVDGRPLDVGAQWLHGKDNPLYRLAVEHDLLSEELSEEGLGLFVRNDGVEFDRFVVERVNFEIGKILETCQSFVNETEYPKSVGDFMEEKFLEYLDSCDDSDELRQMKLELFDWNLRFQIVDNSCHSMKRLSAKFWGSYICLDDIAHYNFKYGYNSLVDVIVKSLPKERIRLKAKVTAISSRDNNIEIICANNQIFHCDHVVITASIGVLKEFSNINPPLPTTLRTAIANMGYYGIGKIYLFFDEKWWGDYKGFQFVWKSNTKFEENEEWTRHMTGFDEVFNQPNALMSWVGSDGVIQMEELPEDEVGRICINVLQRFLPNFQIPQPRTVIRTKWFSDPWVRGSYCHITPECEHPHAGIDKLSEPVQQDGVPRIILAGEAVHPSHYSTTHGAFESGQQQAAMLYEYIKKQSTNTFV